MYVVLQCELKPRRLQTEFKFPLDRFFLEVNDFFLQISLEISLEISLRTPPKKDARRSYRATLLGRRFP